MGLGDAKLALGIGWFLGLSLALSALVLSFWAGTIVGLTLIVLSKIYSMGNGGYGMKSEIPFAPYLALGTFLAFIFQLNLFNIYF
jgi:leader peptidase (prepilin peptidase)/N-methyltransferase